MDDVREDFLGPPVISRVEFSNEKSEECCIYRHAGIDYIALWDSLLPLREVFAAYLGTCV